MAVNGEGGGDGVNKLGGSGDFGASELARIGEQYNRVPYAQRELRRRHQDAARLIEEMNKLPGGTSGPHINPDDQQRMSEAEDLLRRAKDPKDRKIIEAELNKLTRGTILNPVFQKQIGRAQKEINNLDPRLRIYNESTRERLNMQAMNTVNREFSDTSVGSFVSGQINSQVIQASGLGLAAQSGFEDLKERRKSIMGQIGSIRANSLNVAGSLIGEKGVNAEADSTLKENASKIRELAQQLGPIAVAMETQKSLGQDPKSKQRHLAHMGEKASDFLNFEKLRGDIAAGQGPYGNLSASDLKKKETEAATNLVKALDELRNSTGKTKEEIAKLAKTAEEAAENFEEIQEAKAGGAGGNNGSLIKSLGAAFSVAAQVSTLAGDYFQTLGVNIPMANMSNIGGLASIENQKHDSWRAALDGNMTERLNLAGWGTAAAFGNERGDWTNYKQKAIVTGAVLGAGTAGLQIADAITSAPTGKITGAAQTVTNIGQGVIGLGHAGLAGLSATMDLSGQTSETQAKIAGAAVTMDAIRKLNHVRGFQMQQYRDQAMGMYGASMGMGAAGEGFLANTTGASFLHDMDVVGLDSRQTANLANFGAQNIGSMFNSGQMVQAKRFENLGLGSAEENMRRMAMLSGGSTQNPSQSLESMLQKAVSVGLDSSKAISMIAESTGATAEASALAGFANVGTQIQSSILGAVDRSNPNQEMATKRAINAHQSGEQWRNNRAVSWHGMIASSEMMQSLGIGWEDADILQTISVDQLKMLKGTRPEEVKEELLKRGFRGSDAFYTDVNASLTTAISNKVKSQSRGGAGLGSSGGQHWDAIQSWVGKDKDRAMALFGDSSVLPADVLSSRTDLFRSYNRTNPNIAPADTLASQLSILGILEPGDVGLGLGDQTGSSTRDQLGRDNNRGARSRTRAAMKGNDLVGGVAGLDASGQEAERRAGNDPETTWADAAAKSAADFGKSAVKLDSASGKLSAAAEALLIVARVQQLANVESKAKDFKPPNYVEDLESVLARSGREN